MSSVDTDNQVDSVSSIWRKTCEQLSDLLSKDVYDRWIHPIVPDVIEDDTFTLCVANDFYQTWLEEYYVPLIKDSVASICGKKYSIKLVVDHSAAAPPPVPVEEPATVSRKTNARSRPTRELPKLNPKYSFDAFVVGPSNNFAHAASLAVARMLARAYNPLFIYGASGLGKTHLMQAIGHEVIKNNKARVSYLSCEKFVNEYINALQNKGLVDFRRKYRNTTDLLLIDDIHFLAGKERMQEEFFHTFNTLFDGHKQIVLTSDRPAAEIPRLEHRLVTRFEWGLVTELEQPDLETRIAILRTKRNELKLDITDEVLTFLAERIRSSIRRLEGALIRIASFTSLTGHELTFDKMENLLRDAFDQEQQEVISIDKIQKTVADHFDLRVSDLTGNRRPRSIAFPRQIAMFLCRDMTDHSFPIIGTSFDKNHATVLHACRLVESRIQTDPKVRRTVALLRQRIESK